jgi:predicted nucleotidyltransferase
LAELDLGVERLRSALPAFSGVRGALVFGSYARHDVGPDSDLDVIVVRETDLPRFRRDDDIRGALRLGVPYDLITLTPEQFARLPKEVEFYAQAVREGIWIDAARPA